MNAAHETPATHTRPQAWADLWQRGVLHSCAAGIDGNYDGEIARFWAACFARLKPGCRIIDLATGNGALALLAQQHAASHAISFEVHGVDIAEINPVAHLKDAAPHLASIHFHPGVDITRLPFADGSANLVMSQYGFEYADTTAAIREVDRVLADDGMLALLMHSDDSIIARTLPHQLRALEHLLASEFLNKLTAIAELIAQAGTPSGKTALLANPEAEKTRQAFNQAATALVNQAEASPEVHVLKQAIVKTRQVLETAQRGDISLVRTQTARWRTGLEAEQVRLRHLSSALLAPEDLQGIAQKFCHLGFQVETARLYQSGASMGWTLVAHRA